MFKVIATDTLVDITLDEMIPAFYGSDYEIDLDPDTFLRLDTPWLTLSKEHVSELAKLGFTDGFSPRGYGNSDTAFYALDLTEYYDFDAIRVALIDLA